MGFFVFFGALAATACTGVVDGEPRSSNVPTDESSLPPVLREGEPSPLAEKPVDTSIRRLSTRELGNTFEALFGFRPDALSMLPADSQSFVFDRVSEGQTISELHERAYEAIADEVATRLLSGGLDALVPACGTDPRAWDRACGAAFLDAHQPRAYRRPVSPEETAAVLGLFDAGESFEEGFRLLVHRLFRSPHFVYLVEHGTPGDVAGEPRPLSHYEVAARLSYSLCEAPPDAELWAAAEAGTLMGNPDEILVHAHRLLESPCGEATIARFFSQWLRLEEVSYLTRDAARFPEFDSTLALAMKAETERFVSHLVFESNAPVRTLFDATFSIVDEKTAPLYGLNVGDGAPERQELPPERRGILTQASLLALTSDETETSPVRRGVFVLERLLCGHLPPPPPELEIIIPEPDANMTTRERWEQHSSNPVCSGCHQLIDPVGFALEAFDALGKHRTRENGKPIDLSGGIPSFGVRDGEIDGAAQLASAIANLPELRHCFARRWLRFALARKEVEADAGSLNALVSLADQDAPMMKVLAALTTTASFRSRGLHPTTKAGE